MSGCAYCGANGDTKLVRDHVVPRSRGGPDNAYNIVMACEACNKDKRTATATEWLGDRCPPEVKQIENRVNSKLQRDFSKRDTKPRQQSLKCYAFTTNSHGYLEYIGEVVGDSTDTIRIELVDGIMFFFGLWQLSGELKDFPRAVCRIFNDRDCCTDAASHCLTPMRPKREAVT